MDPINDSWIRKAIIPTNTIAEKNRERKKRKKVFEDLPWMQLNAGTPEHLQPLDKLIEDLTKKYSVQDLKPKKNSPTTSNNSSNAAPTPASSPNQNFEFKLPRTAAAPSTSPDASRKPFTSSNNNNNTTPSRCALGQINLPVVKSASKQTPQVCSSFCDGENSQQVAVGASSPTAARGLNIS